MSIRTSFENKVGKLFSYIDKYIADNKHGLAVVIFATICLLIIWFAFWIFLLLFFSPWFVLLIYVPLLFAFYLFIIAVKDHPIEK